MSQAILDEQFAALRRSVEEQIAGARREIFSSLAQAVAKMRSAVNEAEWHNAVLESGRPFAEDPAALELLASLAALTAPSNPENTVPRAAELSAKRFAKVKIAEMQLYQAPAVKAGRAARDLYGALRPQIDAARQAFEQRFLRPGNGIADYLHAELVGTLANDDATLLGPGYPGPLA
ncbi:MAG TPA: hypothetical protein VK419_11685 [Bryobacteraceae bacterium]|nr:hypothetical protein [Bryobacteraceae bacterium]